MVPFSFKLLRRALTVFVNFNLEPASVTDTVKVNMKVVSELINPILRHRVQFIEN